MSGIACLAFFSFACTPAQKTTEPEEINYISYVDPYIGSGEHGHVFVGANAWRVDHMMHVRELMNELITGTEEALKEN